MKSFHTGYASLNPIDGGTVIKQINVIVAVLNHHLNKPNKS
jgi:hypothetical protein